MNSPVFPSASLAAIGAALPLNPGSTPKPTKQSSEAAKVNERWSKTLAEYPEKKAQFDANVAALKAEEAAAKAANLPFTKKIPPAWGGPQGPGHPNTPAGLYNGVLAHDRLRHPRRHLVSRRVQRRPRLQYRKLFPLMIKSWREEWGIGDFPFYWVQLADFQGEKTEPGDSQWAELREAQTMTLYLPNTGQAVIIDIGEGRTSTPGTSRTSPSRLARWALARDYGFKISDSGPVFAKANIEGAGFRVSFTRTDGGLIAPLNTLAGFELAGEDKVFKPAEAKIENDTVVVTSAGSSPLPSPSVTPGATPPVAGLFNKEGLSAVPFRSDSW